MVYWHVETDLIAILIYIVLFIKAGLLNRRKDYTDRIFSLSLILGFVSTLIDIYSSVMMNERMGWWPYEISMIIYGLSVPVLALFWFLYTVTLIFKNDERVARRFTAAFAVIYALYAALIVTNPMHELYFHLTPDIVYSRGVLFIPLIVWSQTVMGAAALLLLLFNWRRMENKATAWLLVLLHCITAGVYYIQIANPGWLIVCSTYAVAFLVCDATFESQRRDALYRTIKNSLEELQAEKEKELAYQKQLEEAVREANRANRAKSEFLSHMSHDIRTPINGIRGMLEIIRRERHDEARVDDCLSKIETSSGHLLSLINDVLDMSKLESGEIVLAQVPFDLRRILADCTAVLGQVALDSGIALTDGTAEGGSLPHPYLIGSPLHLRQVILNIAGNAVKYNHPGGTVRIDAEETSCADGCAVYRFTVRDTGIGISPEFLPHVFQPFAQEHADSRSSYEGTGLGLSIVKKIVDQMGGEVGVESTLGEGSTFMFTLPFHIDPDPPEAVGAVEEGAATDLTGVRLLLVEDNTLNLEIAQYLLEDSGAAVDVAHDGKEAVEQFEKSAPGTYAAILMDVMMPVMNGLEATAAIRALPRTDAADVPIIAMTANAFSEDVQKCLKAGMSAHLAKPLDTVLLLKTITEQIKCPRGPMALQ